MFPEEALHCPRCQKELPVDSFAENRNGPTSITWRCNECDLTILDHCTRYFRQKLATIQP